MKSKVYSLEEPYSVKVVEKNRELKKGWVLIEPKLGSICHADLRYFTGSRRKEALAKKLPMALIHEGIGTVVESQDSKFTEGDRVIIVPNLPGRLFGLEEEGDTDKYSKNGQFMGSGYDGIAQSLISHPGEALVKIPDSIPDSLALLAEMQSVSISAVNEHADYLSQDNIRVAVIGDGPVGFFAAAYLKYKFGLSESKFTVFGVDDEKLKHFDFATTANSLTDNLEDYENSFDMIIEATGGNFAEDAINQAIDSLDNLGRLVLMGVSENRVLINTRDILEKGLTVYGSSRSVTKNFEEFVGLLEESEEFREVLSRILPDEIVKVSNVNDYMDVMNYAAETPHWKKIIMEFEWNN